MGLAREDFAAFFAALHDGHQPFPWQERLLDAVLTTGRWPDQIVAPTGSGKTAVIDVHVFAQALTAENDPGTRPPRRLALVVGRRVLVDDQYEYARELADLLRSPGDGRDDGAVLQEISRLLWGLHRPAPDTGDDPRPEEAVSPLVVARLRGGLPASRAWREDPTAVQVLCATPDMWGSRLLFRGYGTRTLARPREAGLLAFDTVAVVDEAHLSRQLLCTARRVSELATVAEMPLQVRPLQVVETTATPAEQSGVDGEDLATASIAVEPRDLTEETLTDRLTRPKPVSLLLVADWASTREPHRRKVAATMADAVLALLETTGGPQRAAAENAEDSSDRSTADRSTAEKPAHTVGCFVNSVPRAVDVAAQLRSRTWAGQPLNVVVVCGQIRPHDLDRLRNTFPGVLDPQGNPGVDVVVGTQSLEAGVDLDLAGMVTELATGSALAQRAGRVNRRGLREQGPVTVVVPDEEISEKTSSGPYGPEELADALTWVRNRSADPAGFAPWALRDATPPGARPRRPLNQRPEWADAWHWARTSDDLAAEPELGLWLDEDFDNDTSVGLVVRHAMPSESADAIRLVNDLPPRPWETFSVPYGTARQALRAHSITRRGHHEHHQDALPEIVLVRGEEVAALRWRPADDDSPGEVPLVNPGDVVVVDDTTALFTATRSSGRDGFSPPVVAADREGTRLERFTTDDVLMARPTLRRPPWPSRERGGVVLRIEDGIVADKDSFAALATALAEVDDAEVSDPGARNHGDNGKPSGGTRRDTGRDRDDPVAETRRRILRDWLVATGPQGHQEMVASTVTLLEESLRPGGHRICEVRVHQAAEEHPHRVIVLDRRRPDVDEDLRQVWSTASAPVTLDAHQESVAQRVSLLGARLTLTPRIREGLALAATHHDDGKRDPRFQVRLGNRGEVPLAKSRPNMSRERVRRNAEQSGLPSSWRHEQRSVIEAWPVLFPPDEAGAGHTDISVSVAGDDGSVVDPELAARLIGTSHGHGRTGFPHTAEDLFPAQDDPAKRETAENLFDTGVWDDLVERTQLRYGVWGCAFLEALLRAADGQVSEEGS